MFQGTKCWWFIRGHSTQSILFITFVYVSGILVLMIYPWTILSKYLIYDIYTCFREPSVGDLSVEISLGLSYLWHLLIFQGAECWRSIRGQSSQSILFMIFIHVSGSLVLMIYPWSYLFYDICLCFREPSVDDLSVDNPLKVLDRFITKNNSKEKLLQIG